ncbi:pentatricopeptide repeat-containing protein At2g33680-like [Cornus florida]|uniref:pentatricopeptide repeat-containing protein At2g33680-like n=1 Tax=Cornus florida TaxID=4283 RepID=UPI0028A082FB|nr:pentatricopeptide repeat-containing protein At2g33680-like [Cornus florida]
MYAFLPTTVFPWPSKPELAFLPLKQKPPINSLSSSCKFLYKQGPNCNATQSFVNSRVSTSDQTLPLNDWPQVLQHSIGSGDLMLGETIHGFLVKLGFQNDPFSGNNLVNMYAKLNRMDCAQLVFDEMLQRNTITWTSLMNGYLQMNDVESVFWIARQMYRLQEEFNEHTCSVILRACETHDDRVQGKQIHGFVIKSGFNEDVIVGTSLISMYSRSGCLEDAERLLNDLTYKDVRCLNLVISEYGRVGYSKKAIQIFLELLNSGLEPSDYTLTNVISASNGDRDVDEGRQLHGLVFKQGFLGKTSVQNAIITMYGKHGLVEEAEGVFHGIDETNLVSWTALLSVYVKNGHSEKALSGFLEMVSLGIHMDSSCLATVLDGCSESKNLDLGHQIHGFVIKLGLLSDVNVGTALIDLYAKLRKLQSARLVMNSLQTKNITSFNAILVGFTETEGAEVEDAMFLFQELRLAGVKADSITFVQLLALSAYQTCLVRGKSLHAFAIKTGFEADLNVGNAIITMYAKCGSIQDASEAFNGMTDHDSISWNSMISAYALHGQGRKAVFLFEEIIKKGFIPDEITMLGVLQACSYSGLSEYGFCFFNEMERKYRIRPVLEHFACMVDLLGRAGFLSEALDFINKSPYSDSPLLWRTLVHVCKLCGDLSFGKIAAKHLLDLAPKEAGSYILVSNMYAEGGMLDVASKVRTRMKDLKVNKEAGCSWIEIDNKTHRFVASAKDHPESRDIYANLELLDAEMKQKHVDRSDLQLTWESHLIALK